MKTRFETQIQERWLSSRRKSGIGRWPIFLRSSAGSQCHFIRRFVTTLGVLLISQSAGLAQSDADFARANDEFAKKQFQEAIRDYESLVQAKQWSAPLFYNLGNAYFRAGDFGRAILNYERALALDPRQPETAANVALAREESRGLELQQSRFDAALNRLTTSPLIISATIALWITVFGIVVLMLSRRRSAILLVLVLLSCLIAATCAAVAYRLETSRRTVAVVTGKNVQARLATADNASSVLQLPPGSEVRVLSHRGDWVYAALPNNLRGWIPTASVEPVRL
ncbi:MAG TPA: tetratricopeptide repeat protein [Chthoniobacterales bacterium]